MNKRVVGVKASGYVGVRVIVFPARDVHALNHCCIGSIMRDAAVLEFFKLYDLTKWGELWYWYSVGT